MAHKTQTIQSWRIKQPRHGVYNYKHSVMVKSIKFNSSNLIQGRKWCYGMFHFHSKPSDMVVNCSEGDVKFGRIHILWMRSCEPINWWFKFLSLLCNVRYSLHPWLVSKVPEKVFEGDFRAGELWAQKMPKKLNLFHACYPRRTEGIARIAWKVIFNFEKYLYSPIHMHSLTHHLLACISCDYAYM